MKTKTSKQEARKITIIEELLAGRFLNRQTAELLELSVRQARNWSLDNEVWLNPERVKTTKIQKQIS